MNKRQPLPKPSARSIPKKTPAHSPTPLRGIDELEGILASAAATAHHLRLEHDKSLGLERATPRRESREKFRRSMQKLNAQLQDANKAFTRITASTGLQVSPTPSKARKSKPGDTDAPKLGEIEREETRILDLAEKAKSETDFGLSSRRALQERQPFSQRRLRRMATGTGSVRVRGRADQAVDAVITQAHEHEDQSAGAPGIRV